jgi:hypothetical protein
MSSPPIGEDRLGRISDLANPVIALGARVVG